VRDPRDYVCSARAYSRREDIARHYPHLDMPLRSHCEHWRAVTAGILDSLRVEPIRYEVLLAHPRETVDSVLGRLGLPADAACTEAVVREDIFRWHATSASPAESVGRWRRELRPEELGEVEHVCGQMMARLGYRPEST
jgi:hypothetical protein